MKRVLLGLALLGLAVGAGADPANLEGGVLIAHYVADLQLSEAPPDPCVEYGPYAITQAADQVNRIDTSTYALANWFIVAAWTEDKEFCGVQFGFSDYDPAIFGFSATGACFPATGGLEIPSIGWPGPNEGIAFVVTGDSWMGNYLPVYWFIGYAYGYGAPGVIQLVADPTVAEPFGGTGNCASPPEKWDADLGGMGINMDGTYVAPFEVIPEGACCFGTDCVIMTQADCEGQGGEYRGDATACEPINPCDPIWACCVYGECIEVTASQCEAAGGMWYEGEVCSDITCPAYAVCCIGPELHECILAFEDECEALDGVFHPEWDSCSPNLCEEATGADDTSWGTIKSLYR